MNADQEIEFYLHGKTDSTNTDGFKCMVTLYDGANKPTNFKNGTSLVPSGEVVNGSGWFDCKSSTYTVKVPGTATCEICTFEWKYKAPNSSSNSSICVDMWANEIWQDDNKAGLPRKSMTFDEEDDAQKFLDELENKKSFGRGTSEWILMIIALLFSLILLACCCAFCAKRRVTFFPIFA